MDRACRPCCIHHHHHHQCRHHRQLFFCSHNLLHHHHHCHCRRQIRPNFASFPPNQDSAPSPAFFPNVGDSGLGQSSDSAAAQVLQEQELENYVYGIEEEDDKGEEPIFVLTDQWRDFFAKSEGGPRGKKKRAKKGKK